uniref:Thioesterase n=1 Tax=Streptomyces sp. CNH287 TaxID=1288082 RepID=U6A486_9ACTN|nr:thioesterase [Streptomyces sp. CNH287]
MEDRKTQLFCLPHAGGNAVMFHRWKRRFGAQVRIHPIDLAGHGTRRGEPLLTSMEALVRDLTRQIRYLVDGPYLLFGHSLGALLAYELAHTLRDGTVDDPVALLVSGRNGPAVPHPVPPLHHLPTAELLERLDELDGVPPPLLAEPELLDVFLPALRADARIAELYQRGDHAPLACPVRAVAGDVDPLSSVRGLHRWAEETTAECTVETVPGGHMVLEEPGFLEWLGEALTGSTAGQRA